MDKLGKTMFERIREAASRYAENTCLDYYGNLKTYTQLVNEVQQAATILAENGIRQGDRVIVCLPNIPQTVVFIYALNFLGAIPCMVHPLSTAPELSQFIDITESRYAIILNMNYSAYKEVLEEKLDKTIVTGVDGQLPILHKLLYYLKQGRKLPRLLDSKKLLVWKGTPSTAKSAFPTECPQKTDPALILFSGGTSGVPKAVILTNDNMNALADQVLSLIEPIPQTDAMLCILPLFHGFGLGVCLHPVLVGGGRCILVPRFSQNEFAKIIRKKRPAYIAGVPTLFQALLANPKLANTDMSFLKAAFCGGDATPSSLIEQFNNFIKQRKGKATLREGYGLTECVTACTVMPAKEYRHGSVGLPFPGTRVKIVDPKTLAELPPGTEGEICVSGPTVMLGYLNQERETAHALQRHGDSLIWLHTGDWGYIDKDGFIYFLQRIKRIIKHSGYTIYPSQVEEVINSHPRVVESCVIGVPDKYSVEKIKAFVVYKDPLHSSPATARQLSNYIAGKLIRWAVPSEIEFCTELPRTRLGKISFTALELRERNRRTNPAVNP